MKTIAVQSYLYECSYCTRKDEREEVLRHHEAKCLKNPVNLNLLKRKKIIGSTYCTITTMDETYIRIGEPDIMGEKLNASYVRIHKENINGANVNWEFSISNTHLWPHEVNRFTEIGGSFKPCPQEQFFKALELAKTSLLKKESDEESA